MTFTADRAVAVKSSRSSQRKAGRSNARVALALAVGLTATAVAPVLATLTVDAVPQRVAPDQAPVALLRAMENAQPANSADALAQGLQQLNDKQYEEAVASLQAVKAEELSAEQQAQLTVALATAQSAAEQRKTARAAFEEGEKSLAAGDNLNAVTQYATAAHTPNADAATVDKANTQIAVAIERLGDLRKVYDAGKADLDAGNLAGAKAKFWALDALGYKPAGMLDKSPADMLALTQRQMGETPAAAPAAVAAADAAPAVAAEAAMSPEQKSKAARAAYVAGRDLYHKGDIAGAKAQFQKSADLGYKPGFGETGPKKMLVEIAKKEDADMARVARAQREQERQVAAAAEASAVMASQTQQPAADATPAATPADATAPATPAADAGAAATTPPVATTPDISGATVTATPAEGSTPAAAPDNTLAGTAAAERLRQEQNKWQAAHMVEVGDQARAGSDFDKAIASYNEALKLDPNNQAAQQGKAAALTASGRTAEQGGDQTMTAFEARLQAQAESIRFTIQSSLERAAQARQAGDFPAARSALIQAQAARDSQQGIFNQQQLAGFDDAIRAETNATAAAEQKAIADKQASDQQIALDIQNRNAAAAADQRRNTIASLVSQSRQLTEQGRYQESLKVVDQILSIDPRNDYAIGVRPLIQDRVNLNDQRKIEQRLNENLSEVLNQAEEARVPMPDLLTYPIDWPDLSARRDASVARERGGETDQATLALLNRNLGGGADEIKFDSAPFVDAIQFLADSTGANIFVNWPAIEAAGVDKNAPITVSRLRNVKFSKVLQIVLDSAGGGVTRLGYTIDDGVITISTQEDLAKNVSTQTFDIRDLLINVQDFNQEGFDFDQADQGGRGGDPSGGGGGGGGNLFGNGGGGNNDDEEDTVDRQTLVQQIEDLITDTIASDTWKVNNGFIGAIQELGGQLIVTQTPENLAAIRQLLEKLRETRAIQVNIEARFLAVQRNFLEEVGVDFDFQFNVDYGNNPSTGFNPDSDFSPVLVRQNNVSNGDDGTPLGFTAPSNLVTGVQSNLSQGASNYGLNTGVSAFLDDFRASLLLRAVQLGQNSTTLTAPRLTLFNGQRAFIRVTTQQQYVSSLVPVVSAGAVGYTARINRVDSGVFLSVQATVSADRKYVTMTVRPQLSRLVALRSFSYAAQNAVVGNGNGGNVVQTAQQTVQLPEIERTELATTVSVPDRGTLLLGGQTLVGEIQREAGTPVLSKIPFLKRLFTNRGTAKDEQVLLILIKPTIIIQREVESTSFPLLEPQ